MLPGFVSLAECLALGALIAALLAWSHRHGVLRSIHGVERPTLGAALLPLGLALAALVGWAQPASYVLGVLTVGLADPAAALVGSRIESPRWRVWRGTKSLAGSLAFAVVAVAIGLVAALWSSVGLAAILATAVVLALVEGSLGFGVDNLALPPLAVMAWRAVLGP